jgi:hypothetical protein
LADEETRERGVGVHVRVGEQAELFELVGGEEVGFVDDDHDAFAAFVLFGGERVGGLGDERRLVEAGDATQRGDDRGVEAAGADGGVAEVDDRVAGRVEIRGRGSGGDGLAGADLTGDHGEGAFGDAPGDAGDGFAVAGGAVQHLGGEVSPEGHGGEAVVGLEDVDAHGVPLSGLGIWSGPPRPE